MNFQRPLLVYPFQKHFESAEEVDGVPLCNSLGAISKIKKKKLSDFVVVFGWFFIFLFYFFWFSVWFFIFFSVVSSVSSSSKTLSGRWQCRRRRKKKFFFLKFFFVCLIFFSIFKIKIKDFYGEIRILLQIHLVYISIDFVCTNSDDSNEDNQVAILKTNGVFAWSQPTIPLTLLVILTLKYT